MRVENLLHAKGGYVETIDAGATVADAAQRLRTRGIGALIVSKDGQTIEGLVSERDIVTGLVHHGNRLGRLRVGDVMTHAVVTCSPGDTLKTVMAEMTHRRIRHLPVVESGRLVGIISIGDVVKHRLEELELETNVMRDAYIAHR